MAVVCSVACSLAYLPLPASFVRCVVDGSFGVLLTPSGAEGRIAIQSLNYSNVKIDDPRSAQVIPDPTVAVIQR